MLSRRLAAAPPPPPPPPPGGGGGRITRAILIHTLVTIPSLHRSHYGPNWVGTVNDQASAGFRPGHSRRRLAVGLGRRPIAARSAGFDSGSARRCAGRRAGPAGVQSSVRAPRRPAGDRQSRRRRSGAPPSDQTL